MRAALAALLGAIVIALVIATADAAGALRMNSTSSEFLAGLDEAIASNPRLGDVPVVAKMKPLFPGDYVMFWRLQKVGSSTILSILMSYAYRYHFLPRRRSRSNSFCSMIGKCAVNHPLYHTEAGRSISAQPKSNRRTGSSAEFMEKLAQSIRYKISLTHDICNFQSQIIHDSLKCAFEGGFTPDEVYAGGVKEIFMVREPLSRIASIYYFWGELFKMEQNLRGAVIRHKDSQRQLAPRRRRSDLRPVLGSFDSNTTVKGPLFTYHGQESTPPPLDIAMAFAHKFPMRRGFPGPSFSSSAFGMNASDALTYMQTNQRMMSIVLERLDESLIVLRHFLGWSLADVVVTQPRKALSSHPKISQWPAEAVSLLKAKLINTDEYAVYEEATKQLNRHIADLQRRGVNVTHEVEILKLLRNRVKKVSYCFDLNGSLPNGLLMHLVLPGAWGCADLHGGRASQAVSGGHCPSWTIAALCKEQAARCG